jgi:hypothetical protein
VKLREEPRIAKRIPAGTPHRACRRQRMNVFPPGRHTAVVLQRPLPCVSREARARRAI